MAATLVLVVAGWLTAGVGPVAGVGLGGWLWLGAVVTLVIGAVVGRPWPSRAVYFAIAIVAFVVLPLVVNAGIAAGEAVRIIDRDEGGSEPAVRR
ncbi:MAG: hypothetical protein IT303_14775 [Dehalococcoidia bacterium]|nr:hypothetical protein [Dehalococcoidia bacterium]